MSMMKRFALEYAGQGWKVIPIFSMNGKHCACGNPYCTAPGKHPLVATGRQLAGASNDPRQVADWWDQWPAANIAVALGATGSGMVVVDLDIEDDTDGYVVLQQWADGYGIDLGEPRRGRTGSGGMHLFYRLPPDDVGMKNVTSWMPCVDFKADGGYVLLPPSVHESGNVYEWLSDNEPGVLPSALGASLRTAKGHAGGQGQEAPSYDYRAACRSGPRRGTRDHFFNARAFELRKADWSYDDATKELRRHWEACEQSAGDEWPWSEVVKKLDRVWSEVTPDPIPDWDPAAHAKTAADAASGRQAAAASGAPDKKATDVGNSERFADWHHDKATWTAQRGWHVWDGRHWVHDELGYVMELAKDTVRKMFVEAALISDQAQRDAWLSWAQASESRPRIEAMVKLAQTDPRLARAITSFDQNAWLFNCANGTIDLRTGELRPHRREDMITKMSQVPYTPGARSDHLDRYLKSVTEGNDDLIRYLKRAAGYTLTASTREEVLFMIYGPKGSGKSTFISAMQTILGDMSMMTQADTLTHMKGSQSPKDELAAMLGKRMVATVEIQEGERFAEALVKQLTGGDKIAARHLYRDRFEFYPTFKLWIATNHAPRAYDDALWRRIKRVPFPIEVPKAEQDVSIKEALTTPMSQESQAFLAWAVEGCMEWQRDGLGSALVVDIDTEEYREEQDKFGRFIEERLVEDPAASTSAADLYAVYHAWAIEDGERPMTKTAFGIKLKDRGFVKNKSKRPIEWIGLRIAQREVSHYGL